MPEVMEPKTGQSCLVPRLLPDGRAKPSQVECILEINSDLPSHDGHGIGVQGYRNRLTTLRLVGKYPRYTALRLAVGPEGRCPFNPFPFTFSLRSEGLRHLPALDGLLGRDLDNGYKHYCFQTESVKAQFRYFAVGTKVSGVSKSNIAKIEIAVPPLEEQTVAASVLSNMDAELAELEAKLTKARAVKQGMMQELLTGRIRLV
jgi:hypothetical protein